MEVIEIKDFEFKITYKENGSKKAKLLSLNTYPLQAIKVLLWGFFLLLNSCSSVINFENSFWVEDTFQSNYFDMSGIYFDNQHRCYPFVAVKGKLLSFEYNADDGGGPCELNKVCYSYNYLVSKDSIFIGDFQYILNQQNDSIIQLIDIKGNSGNRTLKRSTMYIKQAMELTK